MSSKKQMTPDEIAQVLIAFGTQDLDFVQSEDSFYRYTDGHLEFIDPEFSLPQFITRTLIDLKTQSILKDDLPVSPAMVDSIITLIKYLTPNAHKNIDSPYLCFSKDLTLLDTSTPEFKLLPADRHTPSFIFFPYESSLMQDDMPPHQFLAFLRDTFEDQDMIDFIQMLMGYCLLDSIEAHAVFFFHGGGQNGKSVLLDIIRSLLPDVLINADKLQDLTSNRFRIANLVGKRLNITGEEESKFVKADLFKDISSGEVVTAERKYHGSFKFRPKVKLIFSTNKIPTFDAVDKAMRRRIFIIPFTKTVPDHKRIPYLAQKIIKAEHQQIVRWALEGARHVVANDFKFPRPKLIEEAGRQQEQLTSSAIQFFNDNFQITAAPSDTYPKSHAYTLYSNWCDDENRQRVSKQRFFQEISQRYKEEGVSIPDTPVWDPITKSMARIMMGVKPTDDHTAIINNYAKHTTQSTTSRD